MKTLKLNISERVFALKYLDDFKGSVTMLGKILEDVKSFGISDEEWKRAEKKVTESGDQVQWNWNDVKGGLKDVEVDEEVLKYLNDTIEKTDKANGFTLQDRAVVGLWDKIEESLK